MHQVAVDFLEKRKIDVELASRLGVTTGKGALCFEYRENDQVVKRKFRKLPKEKFWQEPVGIDSLLWNVDALAVAAQRGEPLVITEGELDAISAIQAGCAWTVSVPDGAPPPTTTDSTDYDSKFKFLQRNRESLGKLKRIILATDNDGPGRKLRDELIRRLLPGRCSFVEYPPDCKDLNDVLIKYGSEEVFKRVAEAKPCPVMGLYEIDDYPEIDFEFFQTGWSTLDPHLRLFFGEFMVVTGIPQHGKSTWVMQLLVQMSALHGWRSVVFSPEMPAQPFMANMLYCMRACTGIDRVLPEHRAWVKDRFKFIGANPDRKADSPDFHIDWLMEMTQNAIDRFGVRVMVIDPFNEMEHNRRRDETITEYVGRFIKELKAFAQRRDLILIIVAHPVKQQRSKASGKFEHPPSLYDISDSAHWYNKCDHGLVIWREVEPTPHTEIQIVKSRFIQAGEPGIVKMKRDLVSGRFVPLDYHLQ
jgi:twinkle protein